MTVRRVAGQRLYARSADLIRELVGDDLTWITDEANCSNANATLFFPEGGVYTNAVRELCDTCPLLEACRSYALTHEVQGFWGGMSETDRARIVGHRPRFRSPLEARPATPTAREQMRQRPAPCDRGSIAGARVHQRKGELMCLSCKDAVLEAQRIRRARARQIPEQRDGSAA